MSPVARIVADEHVETIAGLAVALSSPVGFWESFPKRHALAALAVLTAVYCFARSRRDTVDDGLDPRHFRVPAYVAVALYAWLHAAEALLAGLDYYDYAGESVLGLVRVATDAIRLV